MRIASTQVGSHLFSGLEKINHFLSRTNYWYLYDKNDQAVCWKLFIMYDKVQMSKYRHKEEYSAQEPFFFSIGY